MAERTRNRVLVVDDENVIRMAVRKFLAAEGFEVIETVILDYKLPASTRTRCR